METIIQIIISYYKQFLISAGVIIGFVLMKKNKSLREKNEYLNDQLENITEAVHVQREVIKQIKAIKDVTLDGNIKRMHDEKL